MSVNDANFRRHPVDNHQMAIGVVAMLAIFTVAQQNVRAEETVRTPTVFLADVAALMKKQELFSAVDLQRYLKIDFLQSDQSRVDGESPEGKLRGFSLIFSPETVSLEFPTAGKLAHFGTFLSTNDGPSRSLFMTEIETARLCITLDDVKRAFPNLQSSAPYPTHQGDLVFPYSAGIGANYVDVSYHNSDPSECTTGISIRQTITGQAIGR